VREHLLDDLGQLPGLRGRKGGSTGSAGDTTTGFGRAPHARSRPVRGTSFQSVALQRETHLRSLFLQGVDFGRDLRQLGVAFLLHLELPHVRAASVRGLGSQLRSGSRADRATRKTQQPKIALARRRLRGECARRFQSDFLDHSEGRGGVRGVERPRSRRCLST